MGVFGARLGSFAAKAAQNLSATARSPGGQFLAKTGKEVAMDLTTNFMLDAANLNPSENANRVGMLKSMKSSKAGLASQLVGMGIQAYQNSSPPTVSNQSQYQAQQTSNLARNLSQQVENPSNTNFNNRIRDNFSPTLASLAKLSDMSANFNSMPSQHFSPKVDPQRFKSGEILNSFSMMKKESQEPERSISAIESYLNYNNPTENRVDEQKETVEEEEEISNKDGVESPESENPEPSKSTKLR
tara:strand:+ start:98353 stop:99084 length:732 start_codon:yes stop_codon:yes gene_type:complete